MRELKIVIASIFLISFNVSHAQFGELKTKLQKSKHKSVSIEDSKKIYHLLVAARDGSKKQFLEIGENRGTKILTMASCKKCMPVAYTFNTEASKETGKDVFGISGIYVIPYDDNSYISVMPKSPIVVLGEGIWETFQYYNFFSIDKSKVAIMTKEKVENYAIQLSKGIINKVTDPLSIRGGNDVFFVANKIRHSGNYYKNINVEFITSPVKQIKTSVKKNISLGVYYFLPEYSKLLGIDVYGDHSNLREYIFVESNMALIWAKYSSGSNIGNSEWGEYDSFNYFHKDKQIIRKLVLDKNQLNTIEQKLTVWSKKSKIFAEKNYYDKETKKIKEQRLPKKGFKNFTLESEALVAAKNWAKKYNWKETITKAYFIGNDWSIYRHAVTGIQLGRRIRGIIVMKRSDGLCSFHYATFAQQYNGNNYQKVFIEGIVPGQNKMDCRYVK